MERSRQVPWREFSYRLYTPQFEAVKLVKSHEIEGYSVKRFGFFGSEVLVPEGENISFHSLWDTGASNSNYISTEFFN
jgi:hypothetical protein